MFDVTYLAELAITLIGLAISTFLIPYIKSKTSKEEQTQINNWVRIAVTAAEQIYQGSGRGAEKKSYAIQWLKDHNIKYNEAKIDAMIEAAVYELKINGLITTNSSTDNG